jgi:hypothetical protein
MSLRPHTQTKDSMDCIDVYINVLSMRKTETMKYRSTCQDQSVPSIILGGVQEVKPQ